MYDLPLFDYLLEYVLEECAIECAKCEDFDLFTHYAKNVLLRDIQNVQEIYITNTIKITYVQRFPEIHPTVNFIRKSNSMIRSMMLLDFDRIYRVVELRKVESKFGYSYIITLFHHFKTCNYTMVCDFWLPKSCLRALQGTMEEDTYGRIKFTKNQFIRVVGTNVYKGKKYVVIKSYVPKTLKQLNR